MEDLPREMLNEILSRLDKPSLFQASNTCKLWRQQALSHALIINNDEQMEIAARNGDRLSIINSEPNPCLIEWGLWGACIGGHEELAELMMAKGAEFFDEGLQAACYGGHKNLAELMMNRGANNYDEGLWSACDEGHEELAQLMIAKGADEFDIGLSNACHSGHEKLIKLMIANGAERCLCGKSIKNH